MAGECCGAPCLSIPSLARGTCAHTVCHRGGPTRRLPHHHRLPCHRRKSRPFRQHHSLPCRDSCRRPATPSARHHVLRAQVVPAKATPRLSSAPHPGHARFLPARRGRHTSGQRCGLSGIQIDRGAGRGDAEGARVLAATWRAHNSISWAGQERRGGRGRWHLRRPLAGVRRSTLLTGA